MMNVNPTVFILLAEVAGAALIFLPALFLFFWLKRRKERTALNTWVDEIQTAEGGWRERQEAFLKENCGHDDATAAMAATEMLKSRNQLYKCFVDAYVQRQPDLLKTLPHSVESLLETYRAPAVSALTHAAAAAPDESVIQGVVAAAVAEKERQFQKKMTELESENGRLRQDLDGAQEEMKQMMGEYVSAFRGAPPPPAPDGGEGLLATTDHLTTVAEAEAALQAAEAERDGTLASPADDAEVDIDKLLESMTRTNG